jgi:hypothetical protein
MSTGPAKQAAAESIGTSPGAFDEDSDMMGAMAEHAQAGAAPEGATAGLPAKFR